MADPDIVVLPPGDHGHDSRAYAAALRDRLPDRDVRHADTPSEEREWVAAAPVVTGVNLDEALLSRAENLSLFACTWAGYDHLPLDRLAEQGVTVTNAAGVFAPNVAEHVIGEILSFVRRFREGWRRQRDREWRHYQAGELAGSTVTVVGQGSIGRAVVERLEPFDLTTVAVRHSPEKGGPADEVVGYDDDAVADALSRTDYLVLACPLTDTTRGLLGPDEFERLPTHAVIVNIARGGVVQTDALVDALRGQEIRGAALDVTDPEPLPPDHVLWTFDNVHITPHHAGSSPKLPDRFADLLAGNVRRAEETSSYDDLRNQVVP